MQRQDPVRYYHQVPLSTQTLAPVFCTKVLKYNFFSRSSFQNKLNPSLLIPHSPPNFYRWVSHNRIAFTWPPPLVWHRSLPSTFDSVTCFPQFLCHFCSLPHFSHLRFSFNSAMGGRQAETCCTAEITVHSMDLKLSRISTFQKPSHGCWNSYFSSSDFIFLLNQSNLKTR